jgi:hypothetical protein
VWERAAYFGRQEEPGGASFALAQLSLLAAERGDWSAAQGYASESWTLIETAGLFEHFSSITCYIARPRVAVHLGDIAAARQRVGRALRGWQHDARCSARTVGVDSDRQQK